MATETRVHVKVRLPSLTGTRGFYAIEDMIFPIWPRSPTLWKLCYLLIYGDLPTPERLQEFNNKIAASAELTQEVAGN